MKLGKIPVGGRVPDIGAFQILALRLQGARGTGPNDEKSGTPCFGVTPAFGKTHFGETQREIAP